MGFCAIHGDEFGKPKPSQTHVHCSNCKAPTVIMVGVGAAGFGVPESHNEAGNPAIGIPVVLQTPGVLEVIAYVEQGKT